MIFGKTIKISLIDGAPNGRMSCELSNWSGKAYKIPRIKIKDCFSDDFIFTSPSTAAVIVMGRNANGLTEWKTKTEKTLKEVESNEKVITPKK